MSDLGLNDAAQIYFNKAIAGTLLASGTIGAPGTANPTNSQVVAGTDGTFIRTLKTDATGILTINANGSSVVTSPQNGGGNVPGTILRIKAAATTNATVLKAGGGRLFQLELYNQAAYDVFIKFYNKSTVPIVGTDTPIWTSVIKAGGSLSIEPTWGMGFTTGISYAITKLYADSDTTVLVADDVYGVVVFA